MRYTIVKTTTITETFELESDSAEQAQATVEKGGGTVMHNRASGVRYQIRPSVRVDLPKVDKGPQPIESGPTSALQQLQNARPTTEQAKS